MKEVNINSRSSRMYALTEWVDLRAPNKRTALKRFCKALQNQVGRV